MKTIKRLELTSKGKVKAKYIGICYMEQLQEYQMFSFINKNGDVEKDKYYLTDYDFIAVACPGYKRLAVFIKYDPKKLVYKYSSKDFKNVMGWN